jgi:hypothetical protein
MYNFLALSISKFFDKIFTCLFKLILKFNYKFNIQNTITYNIFILQYLFEKFSIFPQKIILLENYK